ncbi:MAG: hypothetical protein WCG45_04820 [bacterium]
MKITKSNTSSVEAILDFSVEETKVLFDSGWSGWNYTKSSKLKEWVNVLFGPTRHHNLTSTMRLKSVRGTKQECEEALLNAIKYIKDTIEEFSKKS